MLSPIFSMAKNLNKYMIVALSLIYLAGLALIVSSVWFAVQFIQVDTDTITNIDTLIDLQLFLFIFGIILILIGIYESFGIIKRIKKILDNPNLTETFERNFPSTTTGRVGSGLQIIRPMMPKSSPDEVKQVQKSSSISKIQTDPKPNKILQPSQNAGSSKKTDFSDTSIGLSLEDALQMIVDRYNTEKVRKSFKNWNHTLMMKFSDLGTSYLYIISGINGLEFSEGIDENAAVQVKMDSMVYRKMMNKQINPIKAYSSGALEVKGEMKNMLK